MTLSTADRLAIHELVALHGYLADERRADDLHLLLTEDAAYDVTAYDLGVVSGLSDIGDLFRAAPGDQPVGHHVTNVRVEEPADDTLPVTVRSKGLSVMADGAVGTVVYEDHVVPTTAGWRISRRRVVPSR